MSMLTLRHILSVMTMLIFLSACTSKEDEIKRILTQQISATEKSMQQLENALNNKQIRNAEILKQYAETVSEKKPELAPLAQQLAKDATTEGMLYKGLEARLIAMNTVPESLFDWEKRADELALISEAAQLTLFNDALSDPINVLADLSDGELTRVNAMSRASEMQINGQDAVKAGSQLVGNPNYGNWVTGGDGLSFWEWYGIYSLIDNLTDNRRYRYDSWSSRRGYSYYSDYGHRRYTKPADKTKQTALYNKTKKSFAARGQSFKGPYSKKRIGASSLSRASHTATKRSSFASRSSYSSNSGNVRNSSSRTSRGSSRGK